MSFSSRKIKLAVKKTSRETLMISIGARDSLAEKK